MPSFRHLTVEDLSECMRIWQELESHYDHPIGGAWTETKIIEEITSHFALGAFNDQGQMEAFCLYRKAPGHSEILLLATQPRSHRTGAMRALIQVLVDELAPDEVIWLEVHAGNLPAIGLYEAFGFRLTGERENYYHDGGKALLFEYKPLQ